MLHLIPLPQITQFAEEMNLIWVPVNLAEFLDLGFCICVGMAQLWISLYLFFDMPLQGGNASYDNEIETRATLTLSDRCLNCLLKRWRKWSEVKYDSVCVIKVYFAFT